MLPNADRAIVEIEKLRDYCLNDSHAVGKHKARVFRSRLGLTAADAEWLRSVILKAVRSEQARPGTGDGYGQRYVVDFECMTGMGAASIRTAWIVLPNEDVPRLTSCYVL